MDEETVSSDFDNSDQYNMDNIDEKIGNMPINGETKQNKTVFEDNNFTYLKKKSNASC